MQKPWTVTPEKIGAAVQRIVDVGQPSQVIVFGSAARSGARPPHDLDLLVVTKDDIAHPRHESVRLRRALRGISMSVDILVISARRLRQVADHPGLVYREALRHGKVVYEAPA